MKLALDLLRYEALPAAMLFGLLWLNLYFLPRLRAQRQFYRRLAEVCAATPVKSYDDLVMTEAEIAEMHSTSWGGD
jgi:hypothetical protein